MSDPSPPTRRFLPEPVETSTKSNRRNLPEPIETSEKSNRPKDDGVESKDFANNQPPTPKRRFLPEPVETTVSSNRNPSKPAPELTPEPSPKEQKAEPVQRTIRRFTPQLIETSVRSKKQGSPMPATLPTDKTDITPGTNHIYQPKRKLKRPPTVPLLAPENTPVASTERVTQITIPPRAPRKQNSMRPHPNTRRSTRQNSYIPALESIESVENSSDQSEEENEEDDEDDEDDDGTPSLSGSLNSSEDSIARMQLARTRESCDDRFSGYLLELAAKAAEKQLREQALAAFPNSDFHDPVEHFYDREIDVGSDDDSVGIGLLPHEILDRRESMAGEQVGWAQKEMQQHLDKLEQLREHDTNQKIADEATKPSFKDPFWTNGMTAKGGADRLKEKELDKMRSAASPPMLGEDLKFRMCPSPKATMFDTDQRFDVKPVHRKDGGGLWGGYCVADDEQQYVSPAPLKAPPMISTPGVEKDDPFASAFSAEIPNKEQSKKSRPTSSGKGVQMISGIDERLKLEAAKSKLEEHIQEEFDDEFVTQVFNYLSLGYPSLARHYDEEISKITKIPESELNKEDKVTEVQGHIRLKNDNLFENGKTNGTTGAYCPRWKALRLYIIEWARQNPSMEDSAMGPSAWGVRARRGSWAI